MPSSPASFDIALARELAGLVVAAYDEYTTPSGRPSRWPLAAPYELVATFSARLPFHDTETFGFVARRTDSGDAFVAFRGTESVQDWLMNVEVRQVPQQNGWGSAEAGFADVYDQCARVIRAAVQAAGTGRLYVTGHSLGAAVATLCAADLTASLGVHPTLYTFASPRAGDPVFAARFNAECPSAWRIVNTEDVITTVPPPTSVLDRSHPDLLGRLIEFLSRLPLVGRWVRQRLGWTRVWRTDEVYEHIGTSWSFTENLGTVLANHDMTTYVDRGLGPRARGLGPEA